MKHWSYLLVLAAALSANLPGPAQVHASETPAPRAATPAPEPMDQPGGAKSPPVPAAAGALAESHVFRHGDMPVRVSPNGTEGRAVAHGTLRTGESVNLHESTQPAGAEAVPLHVIHHSEFIYVQQGTLTFEHEAPGGKLMTEETGPGGVIYVAAETNHRIRTAGAVPATYLVVAIGGDAR